MSGTTRVLVAAHDAGGARALIPVVEVLRARGAVVLAVVAGPAASLWAAECPYVAAEEVSDDVTVASAAERLDAARTELLLTACGLYNRMEHTFRLAASGRRIRTVAVLDSWLNYRERFERTSAAGLVRCIPHVVCVMDGTSRRDLEAAGLAAERVVVTGPPNLEASVTVARSVTPEQRVAWRHEAGIAVDDLAMVFFSEPFVIGPGGAHFEGPGALIRPDGGSFYGYTAVDTLTAVLDELHGAHRAPGGRVRVIVKPHPAEWAEPLRAIARKRSERSVHVIVRDDGPAVQWISVADVAVGMMSIALLPVQILSTASPQPVVPRSALA